MLDATRAVLHDVVVEVAHDDTTPITDAPVDASNEPRHWIHVDLWQRGHLVRADTTLRDRCV
jgi:hypothetical protein